MTHNSPPPRCLTKMLLDTCGAGFVLLGMLLAFWEFSALWGWIDTKHLPAASEILLSFARPGVAAEILAQLLVTVKRVLFGLLIGSSFGCLLGFVCGYTPGVYAVVEFTVELLRPIPSVILIPIAILFLGIGNALNIGVIAWACSWPLFINAMDGVRAVDHTLLNTARLFGLGPWGIISKVYIPSALPWVASGLRVSLGIAVAVGVITEMVAGGSGIGFFILTASLSYHVSEMYAGIIGVGLMGYGLTRAFLFVEGRVLKWNKRYREIAR